MPNWIEGSLKVRGSSESLKNFLENAILPNSFQSSDVVSFDKEWDTYSIKADSYLKDTKRAFISESCDVWIDSNIICLPIKQAWGFVYEDYINLSKAYKVDIRLYGFECGMEFCQEIEVLDGKVTIDRVIKYHNYDWECPMPNLGG